MPIRRLITATIMLLFISLPGCGRDQPEDTIQSRAESPRISDAGAPGCQSCHPFELKGKHAEIGCTACHEGDNRTNNIDEAHTGMTAHPAHPDKMQAKCGRCHAQAATAPMTSHFTLQNEVNMVRRHFGAEDDLASLKDIPLADEPSSPLELAEDLLRRRCLRCHVYYEGDDYSQVSRGTGCGACHLQYRDGKLVSHEFLLAPTEDQCLSCHYANRVGSDYLGRFDHDFKHEYRTPYEPDGSYPSRSYGIEQHQLSSDIHQKAGMTCLDCHPEMHSGDIMSTISCEGCHLVSAGQSPPAGHLSFKDGTLFLNSWGNPKPIRVPPMTNPVHTQKKTRAACVVCHAIWTYNDQNTHLIRIDNTDYEEWEDLIVQESSEAEALLLNGIYGDEELDPVMSDKISGELRRGIWLKGFRTRRWEVPIIAPDQQGTLQIMRPILDLHISWVDDEGETGFDSITGRDKGLKPYTPHTIGKAGAFYKQRLDVDSKDYAP